MQAIGPQQRGSAENRQHPLTWRARLSLSFFRYLLCNIHSRKIVLEKKISRCVL
jgi:hypothetical protein